MIWLIGRLFQLTGLALAVPGLWLCEFGDYMEAFSRNRR